MTTHPRVESVAVHQPNFLPWIGFFHKMLLVDAFVLLNTAQFSKGSFANRTRFKHRIKGPAWLTIPVRQSKSSTQNYNEIEVINSKRWLGKQTNRLKDSYQSAPHFSPYFDVIYEILSGSYPDLASVNIELLKYLINCLQISTKIYLVSELLSGSEPDDKNLRHVAICHSLRAKSYLSGQGGKSYNDEKLFDSSGVKLSYHEFIPFNYPQQHDGFVKNLSVIDLLFNCGPESRDYLESSLDEA